MEANEFEVRKQELIDECTVPPEVFDRLMPRLEQFMVPFLEPLVRKEQVEHATTFVRGLLSDLQHKNAESIAYFLDKSVCRCSGSWECPAGTTSLCAPN